jgi:hypothetical protein
VKSEHATKPDITIPHLSRGAPADSEIWQWSRVASVIEVKANSWQDPFDMDVCKTTQESDETFAQLAKNGRNLLMGNFSCFSFVLGMYGRVARIYRFDRAGVIVSKAFDYVSRPQVLGEFFWRFFHPIGVVVWIPRLRDRQRMRSRSCWSIYVGYTLGFTLGPCYTRSIETHQTL